MTHTHKNYCEGISSALYHFSPSKNNVALIMCRLQWGFLLPTTSYTVFLEMSHAKRRMISCSDKTRCKAPGQSCLTGYLHSRGPCQNTPSAARLHPQGLTPPSSLPRQWCGFGHNLVAYGLFPALWKGKKSRNRDELPFVCLPQHP